MSEIKVELGEPEVAIDYSALAESLMEYATDTMNEIANEAIDHYVRYEMDVSDMVSDMVSDQVNDSIDSLLSDVTPGSLCGIGMSFANAIQVVMTHHIDMEQVLLDNESLEKGGMMDTLVGKALNKQMVVNVTFVDKQPAELVESLTVENVASSEEIATNLLPVDEINTRKDYHEGRENV